MSHWVGRQLSFHRDSTHFENISDWLDGLIFILGEESQVFLHNFVVGFFYLFETFEVDPASLGIFDFELLLLVLHLLSLLLPNGSPLLGLVAVVAVHKLVDVFGAHKF
jgi:hypothetical protein